MLIEQSLYIVLHMARKLPKTMREKKFDIANKTNCDKWNFNLRKRERSNTFELNMNGI